MSSVTGTVVSKPCMTMPSESPTRMKSTKRIDDRRGMGVIGGERDDRLAALAGADVVRGEAAVHDFGGHRRFLSSSFPVGLQPIGLTPNSQK